jgi:hypothetical protein
VRRGDRLGRTKVRRATGLCGMLGRLDRTETDRLDVEGVRDTARQG